ncbi:uncharacterized protein E0L32_000479 [Thyridium curvatum]|uniref:ATPase synthesis protein 25 n=1 Tax=Thyridium curvatum TaxID=1093900 RepID=A0A507ATE4_9PEZI|nr:uncharacterized protein E0L32_000479 [Thyridium curvatum]TPX14085.1 hypothetical protein E0L32_000479 [Thyridium curvatum]
MIPSALKAAGCPACRSSLLGSLVGRQMPAIAPRHLRQPVRQIPPISSRFSSSTIPNSATQTLNGDASALAQPRPSIIESEQAQKAEDASEVPWYLEVEPPRHPTVAQPQAPLPDVPPNAPPVVEPLIKFVGDDLGLDELNLLDLRSLDPPPALGPKLLMLFGSARSERHLHVSADRLVRWLRGYGIHASADGLLGRNELKIKLRRKARKAALLGNRGRAPGEDDGISTRWICVNLGTIGWAAEEQEVVDEEGRHSGFGTPQLGTTIVIQMFTEAKRKDLDLETLWTRMLKRSQKAAAVDGGELEYAAAEVADVDDENPWSLARLETRLPDYGAGNRQLSQPSLRRFLSTSAHRSTEVAISEDIASLVSQPNLDQDSMSRLSRALSHDVDQKVQLLENAKAYLASLPPAAAVENLQPTPESSFLKICRLAMSNIPAADTWSFRAWLHSTARILGRPEFTFAGLKQLIAEMQSSGVAVTREQYLQLLRAIYSPEVDNELHVQERSALALEVLNTMFERGEPLIANDVIVSMVESLVTAEYAEAESLQQVLENFMKQVELPCPDEKQLLRLLDAYAAQDNWDRFWEVWRMPPRYRKPRSPAMYEYMYRRLASTNHEVRCLNALRDCFEEMLKEEPPVPPVGTVMDAIKECIRVADPKAEALAAQLRESPSSVNLRKLHARECVRILTMKWVHT